MWRWQGEQFPTKGPTAPLPSPTVGHDPQIIDLSIFGIYKSKGAKKLKNSHFLHILGPMVFADGLEIKFYLIWMF